LRASGRFAMEWLYHPEPALETVRVRCAEPALAAALSRSPPPGASHSSYRAPPAGRTVAAVASAVR
jgi:hypothetical protein